MIDVWHECNSDIRAKYGVQNAGENKVLVEKPKQLKSLFGKGGL